VAHRDRQPYSPRPLGAVVNVAERDWDPRYLARWKARIETLAARATRAARDPAEEEARLRHAATRAARVVEHGTDWADAMELAERPLVLDLSAEVPQPRSPRHPPARQIHPRRGSLRASAGARLRRIRQTGRAPAPAYRGPRGFVASLQAEGASYAVTDSRGVPVPRVALTAAGNVVEFVPVAEPGDVVEAHQICACTRFTLNDLPSDLSAGVVRFGQTVLDVVRELAKT
jgi:hypothetical protein